MRISPPPAFSLLALLLALAGAAGPVAAQSDKGIAYRWVDEHGVVHYGDSIPPKYARDSRQILNSQGVEIGRVDAAKTPAQLAAATRARAQRAAQQQHDYFLLSTYTSVKDIESLRDERVSQIEAQQTTARQYVQSLQSRLGALQSRAQQFKPYSSQPQAPRMPDDLAQELVQTLSEVRVQDQAIQARDEQEAQVKAQFHSDIERFEQLKAAPP
ncbi:MAG TPA: DUF4124 domain-containing protein [Steroidobacteraceae bacterium]|jgi:hypothetical protein|nr:DUF4124 domain-containing protein [Steroidobacteraceae bacterium]